MISRWTLQASAVVPVGSKHPLVALTRDSLVEALEYEPKFRVESGRTDSIYFNQMEDMKTVIPIENAHIPNEYVNIRRLGEFGILPSLMMSGNT